MNPRHRKMLGNIFLILTLFITATALSQGGLWWAGVTLFAALTLWGIGVKNDGS